MPVGNFNDKARVYYSAKKVERNGKESAAIVSKTADGTIEHHGYLEGYISNIVVRDDTYQGAPIKKLEVVFESDFCREIFSVGMFSGPARDILLKVPTVTDFKRQIVRFTPYLSEADKLGTQYLHIGVRINGEKAGYAFEREQVPQIEILKVKNKEIKDTEARDNFFLSIAKDLHARLNQRASVEMEVYNEDDELDAANRLIAAEPVYSKTKDGVPF